MPLNQTLDQQERTLRIAFISSYIPRKCGIASFTKDLSKAINDLNPESLCQIIAIDPDEQRPDYPEEVSWRIERDKPESYLAAADYINQSEAEIVCLQHEYGLFSGVYGDQILNLLRALQKPVVTTLHTILENPTPQQRIVFSQIAELSDVLIAMLPNAKELLEKTYGFNSDRLVVIHHGVTDRPRALKAGKTQLGWNGRQVLLMTGLLSPNKGAEYVVEAMAQVIPQFPNTHFVIVGQTHPEIIRNFGEAYRQSLVDLANSLAISDHIHFSNHYVSLEALLEHYEACDIYLTPHLDPQQVSSGTLAYALGMGKACISTPYTYAREMLGQNRGILVPFRDSQAIAQAVLALFSNPSEMHALESRAYSLGRTMSWPRCAQRYLNLFRLVTAINESVRDA